MLYISRTTICHWPLQKAEPTKMNNFKKRVVYKIKLLEKIRVNERGMLKLIILLLIQ